MRLAGVVAATLLLAQAAGADEIEKRAQADPRGEVAIANVAGDLQVTGQPVSFSFGREQLGVGYRDARAELDKRFQQRIATLPPADRARVERNLADLRRAADELSATLAQHPSDPLLQDLLMSTYQSELQLLANVSELPTAGSLRTDL